MSKQQLRNIMMIAWAQAKDGAAQFGGKVVEYLSQALCNAWAIVKGAAKFEFNGFKSWFRANLTDHERFVLSISDAPVLAGETEKAVKLAFDSDFGKTYLWAPKSALLSPADWDAADARRYAAFSRYDRLVAWAKENGIKGVRKMMKKTTIIKKVIAAGMTVPAELA